MSVYTAVSYKQADNFLSRYALGRLLEIQGVSEGIENTVYFIFTDAGEYVLTLFETQKKENLHYYLELMNHAAQAKTVPTPVLVVDRQGQYLNELCGKPATLVERLAGTTAAEVTEKHCRIIGDALARLHQVMSSFRKQHANRRGLAWMISAGEKLFSLLPDEEKPLLRDEINYQREHSAAGLPQGTIHADLFRDNALFQNDRLGGVIDFYYACTDVLLYDLAIVVNDWCMEENGRLDASRYQALIGAYRSVRPVNKKELRHWPRLLRLAALRFWLSRLEDHYAPRLGHDMTVKNPHAFKHILLGHRRHADSL